MRTAQIIGVVTKPLLLENGILVLQNVRKGGDVDALNQMISKISRIASYLYLSSLRPITPKTTPIIPIIRKAIIERPSIPLGVPRLAKNHPRI